MVVLDMMITQYLCLRTTLLDCQEDASKLATDIENTSLEVPEIRLTSTTGAREMNILDSVCASSLGDSTQYNNHSLFDQSVKVSKNTLTMNTEFLTR